MRNRFLVISVVMSAIAACASLTLPDARGQEWGGCGYTLTPLPWYQGVQYCTGFDGVCPECDTTTDPGNVQVTEYSGRDRMLVSSDGYDSVGTYQMPCTRVVTCAIGELQRDTDCTQVIGLVFWGCTPTEENRYCQEWIGTPQPPFEVLDWELYPCIAGM